MAISPVLLYLRQHQIRLILKSLKEISVFRPDRPIIKPKDHNSVIIWWKYASKSLFIFF